MENRHDVAIGLLVADQRASSLFECGAGFARGLRVVVEHNPG
jgi:hypothetical protein